MGIVQGTEWQKLVLPLDGPPGTTVMLNTSGSTAIQYPITMTGFTVTSWASGTPGGSGTIYVDDIEFESGKTVFQHEFTKTNGDVVRALWTLDGTANVSIPTTGPNASVRNWQNQVTVVQASGGAVTVSASQHPIFVTLSQSGSDPTPSPSPSPSPTLPPVSCSPTRPKVDLSVTKTAPDRFQVTVKVTGQNNRLQSVQFGPVDGGLFDIVGYVENSPGNTEITLQPGMSELTFTLRRTGTAGVHVPLTVVDRCPTPWKTFAGAGPNG